MALVPDDGFCMQRELTLSQLTFLLGGDPRAIGAVRARYAAGVTRIPTLDVADLLTDWVAAYGGTRIPGVDCVVPDWSPTHAELAAALLAALYALCTPELIGRIEEHRRAHGFPDLKSHAAHEVVSAALARDPALAARLPERVAWHAAVEQAKAAFDAAVRQAVADAPPLPPPQYRAIAV